LPLVDRFPTENEIEQLRLILSAYQDGSGMLNRQRETEPETLPGWRDFERATALALNGLAIESKWIYDVVLKARGRPLYGIDCKMRSLLNDVKRKGVVSIEISNAASDFWNSIKAQGLSEETYQTEPAIAGKVIIDLVESWHEDEDIRNGGTVDTNKSYYFVLQWHRKSLTYQLFQYPARLPNPSSLNWIVEGSALRAYDDDDKNRLVEWYGFSGGQLKYYPKSANAMWSSSIFSLEPLPQNVLSGTRKAELYFPELWAKTLD
ncbi:MAG: hypothetical protein GY943_37245, partial [Chloroflexi bacterium]|nr:hypothetical protein [Chloroflexota bacterium]